MVGVGGELEAPASKLKRLANSIVKESPNTYPAIANAARMTKGNKKNAERDLHKLFKSLGLSLPIEMRMARFGLVYVQYIPLTEWCNFLMKNHPEYLLGGYTLNDSLYIRLLQTFWKRLECSMPDHWLFEHREESDLCRCVPFYLHLDEGTGLRKHAVMVYNMQPVWGQSTAASFEAQFRASARHDDATLERIMVESQSHNQKGTTYKSRFLFACVPKKLYTKKFARNYDRILDLLAEECVDLMVSGLNIRNTTWYFICLGLKADAPALAKAGHFTRSFLKLSVE